jgi:glycosyltransferase involved in cell wall biosynthesis
MRISAHPIHDHPVAIEPAPTERSWPGEGARLFADPSLRVATGRGWDVLCPYGFEAVWNGGADPAAIHISAPGFVSSRVGHGVLTFETGYLFQLDPGHDLWVRGPINQLKDGIQPLDQVIESDLLPFVGEINWRFTRAGEIVRFERGEPFGTLLPYPARYIEQFEGHVAPTAGLDLPAVSCVCPTYARPELLAEAVHSFLRQDYRGPKELIVLNDYPGQTLELDHPDVHVINVGKRFRTLGEKLNAAVGLASHDLIFVWSDDDVYLPHRLSLSVDRFDQKKGFFKTSRAYFWNDRKITGLERNTFHGASCFSRDLFTRVRGYPHASVGVDQAIEALFLRERFESALPSEVAPEETYYVYRWAGTGSYHLSSLAAGDGDPNANYRAVAEWVDREAEQGRIPQGRVQVAPGWRQDYAALARRFVAGLVASRPVESAKPPAPVAPVLPPIVYPSVPAPVDPAEATALFRGDAPLKMSVVLPAANESVCLRRTVEQFRATLPASSEIIVVDNGSSDGSADFLRGEAELLNSHEPGADRSRTVRAAGSGVVTRLYQTSEQLGVAGARNKGLCYARGEVVVFADAHVDVPPNWWPPLVATLNRPNVGLVGPTFGVLGDPANGGMCGQRVADDKLRTQWLPKLRDTPYPVPVLGGGFMAMRRAVIETVGGFDPGMQQWGHEDLEISLRTWLLGYEVWLVPEVDVPHYFRDKNPYQVEWKYVAVNLLRTAFLHLDHERLARAIHGLMQDAQFPRALAMCVESDVWDRRADLLARRAHDADWFFNHPYFRDIEMPR